MDNYKLFSRKLSFRFSNLLLISIVMISKIQFTGCSTTCKGIQLLTDTSCFNDVITFNHDKWRAGHASTNLKGDMIIEFSLNPSEGKKRLF